MPNNGTGGLSGALSRETRPPGLENQWTQDEITPMREGETTYQLFITCRAFSRTSPLVTVNLSALSSSRIVFADHCTSESRRPVGNPPPPPRHPYEPSAE